MTNPGLGNNNEPVVAQPLYVTNVTIGTTSHNMLLVATLSDYVYAFDTTTPPAPGAPNYLWTPINLATAHSLCGSAGVPFNNDQNGFPGVQRLGYYGVVATPVIDTAPSKPTAFVTSACVDPSVPTTIWWYIDAIDLTAGSIVASQLLTDSVGTFNPSNQISRAALLLTHPAAGKTYVYVTFGDGVREIGAETGSGGSSYRYTGAEFVLPYTYSSSSFSAPLQPVFYTTCTGSLTGCTSSGVFPSVYAGLGGSNYPTGPADRTGLPAVLTPAARPTTAAPFPHRPRGPTGPPAIAPRAGTGRSMAGAAGCPRGARPRPAPPTPCSHAAMARSPVRAREGGKPAA